MVFLNVDLLFSHYTLSLLHSLSTPRQRQTKDAPSLPAFSLSTRCAQKTETHKKGKGEERRSAFTQYFTLAFGFCVSSLCSKASRCASVSGGSFGPVQLHLAQASFDHEVERGVDLCVVRPRRKRNSLSFSLSSSRAPPREAAASAAVPLRASSHLCIHSKRDLFSSFRFTDQIIKPKKNSERAEPFF